jgi:hypothetical protein
VNDNRQHDRLVQRRADADSIHALMPMALVQTRPGPKSVPSWFTAPPRQRNSCAPRRGRRTRRSSSKERAACPRTPVDKNLLAPEPQRARVPSGTRRDPTRAARALRPPASALGPAAIQIQGGLLSPLPIQTGPSEHYSLFPSCHCLRALLLFALLLD